MREMEKYFEMERLEVDLKVNFTTNLFAREADHWWTWLLVQFWAIIKHSVGMTS